MNLFNLFAKISLDTSGYDKGLSSASGKMNTFKNGLSGVLSGVESFGDKLVSAGEKVMAVGEKTVKTFTGIATAVGAAAAAVGKEAVESYAEYEQLVGGVETLFKGSSSVLKRYAREAYKTAGISANEYMSMSTSFSASLLQSLENDTLAAVKYADMAIIDMSDNANKMGTDISMIQNAYQGFAKQNYTMLDNLNTMGALAA